MNATAIGAFSRTDCNNCMVLGGISGTSDESADTKVGIGTTTPSSRLHIKANSNGINLAQLLLEESELDFARLRFSNTAANKFWDIAAICNSVNLNAGLNFAYKGVGDILRLFGNGNAALMGTLTQNSDARLKTNILPVSNLSSSLLQLNGYSYQWKNEDMDQSEQIGLLAQEVEKYFPQLVKTDEQGFKSVNYIGFIPLLIENMKEQHQKMESLENDMKEMKEIIRQLKETASKK